MLVKRYFIFVLFSFTINIVHAIIFLIRRNDIMVRLNEDLLYQIFSIVDEIPYGKVATYGQIARLTGHEKNARLVGKAMSLAQFYQMLWSSLHTQIFQNTFFRLPLFCI